ncbi:hypothetical protein MAMP_01269 [Methylophaga aminisulfidivorans MP]|uniref:Uncharacterized protein n=1 Tax=Methylophaga aminisulfidivorans MP TaxID=1026882 RepID=F5SYR0_9GAMM|nr:hypothetical protein MAMP_01269 [Methylophaga aminisulfidivorans MP]
MKIVRGLILFVDKSGQWKPIRLCSKSLLFLQFVKTGTPKKR